VAVQLGNPRIPKMVVITAEFEEPILALYANGVSINIISACFKLQYSTLHKFIKRKTDESPLPPAIRMQERKLGAIHYRQIEFLLLENPKLSYSNIVSLLNLPCTKETLRKSLLKLGYKSWKVKSKILLTDRHKQLRVEFCQEMLQLTDTQLCQIIFSDEFTVSLDRIGGRNSYIAKFEKEELNKKKSSFVPKMMFWGCVSSASIGSLTSVSGTVNAVQYINILEEFLLPELEESQWNEIRFMHDNAPCHKAALVTTFLSEKRINVLNWPPYSPDLNPIENLFGIIKGKMEKLPPVRSLDEVGDIVLDMWKKITPEEVYKLCSSFKGRLEKCLELGGATIGK
jgi:transposase